jgi:hypothetical protein
LYEWHFSEISVHFYQTTRYSPMRTSPKLNVQHLRHWQRPQWSSRILDILSSILDADTGYFDWGYSWLSSVLPGKSRDSILNHYAWLMEQVSLVVNFQNIVGICWVWILAETPAILTEIFVVFLSHSGKSLDSVSNYYGCLMERVGVSMAF